MGFEIVKKGSAAIAHAPMTISITRSGFSLGSEIAKLFEGYDYVEVHLDYDGNRIGFKPTNNKITGFKLNRTSGKSTGFNAAAVSKRVAVAKYTGYIEDGMAIANVPEIAKE